MINKIVPELTDILKQKFSHDLLSVVLFGSFVKGTFTSTSDIDVLIICNNLPKDWRERDRMALELTEDIEIKHTIPIHMVLISKNEISHAIESAYPLMLEIYDANKIIYDKDNFFKQLMIKYEKNLSQWRAEKISKGIWKIPGLAVIKSG